MQYQRHNKLKCNCITFRKEPIKLYKTQIEIAPPTTSLIDYLRVEQKTSPFNQSTCLATQDNF